MGCPAFAPSVEQRKKVESMAQFGIPEDDIALVLGIDAKTLRKHFRLELDVAFVKSNAKVAEFHLPHAALKTWMRRTRFTLGAAKGLDPSAGQRGAASIGAAVAVARLAG